MRTKHWRRIGQSAALVVLLVALVLPQAWAQGAAGSPRDKFRSGQTVTIPADETVPHDLYVAGSSVRVAGRIEGDLFVAGGTIDVSGPVTGDLFAAGGTVTISAPVDQHLRVAGGNVSVSGPVGQDLLVAAGTLDLTSTARVGGDVIFTAGRAALEGAVQGSALGSSGAYTRGGTIGGSEDVTLREARVREAEPPSATDRFLGQVRRYLSIVLVGALLLWLMPRLIQPAATRLRERPLTSLGVGALTFAGFFVVILALFIAMVLLAIPLGLLGLGRLVVTMVAGVLLGMGVLAYVFVAILLFVAAAVVGLALGRLLLQQAGRYRDAGWARRPYVALLLGVLIVVVLTALPLVGGILNAIVVLLGLGALAIVVWQQRLAAKGVARMGAGAAAIGGSAAP